MKPPKSPGHARQIWPVSLEGRSAHCVCMYAYMCICTYAFMGMLEICAVSLEGSSAHCVCMYVYMYACVTVKPLKFPGHARADLTCFAGRKKCTLQTCLYVCVHVYMYVCINVFFVTMCVCVYVYT